MEASNQDNHAGAEICRIIESKKGKKTQGGGRKAPQKVARKNKCGEKTTQQREWMRAT